MKFVWVQVLNDLKYTNIESINKKGIKKFVDEIQLQLNEISNEINRVYFYQNNL